MNTHHIHVKFDPICGEKRRYIVKCLCGWEEVTSSQSEADTKGHNHKLSMK